MGKFDGVDFELLADIYKVIDKRSAEVESCLAAGDAAGFTTAVHTLKTNCRMIGETVLSEKFLQLEMLGKAGDLEACGEIAAEAVGEFRRLGAELASILKDTGVLGSEAGAATFSALEVGNLLALVAAACAEFDLCTAETATKKLLTYNCDKELYEKLSQLNDLVNDLEYDQAMELAKQLQESIG